MRTSYSHTDVGEGTWRERRLGSEVGVLVGIG